MLVQRIVAAKGQGRAVALAFAKEGANIIAFDLGEKIPYPAYNRSSNDELEKLKEDVEALGAKIVIYAGDVRKAQDVKEAVERGVDQFGTIDILFSNAGIAAYGKSYELEEDEVLQETFCRFHGLRQKMLWRLSNIWQVIKQDLLQAVSLSLTQVCLQIKSQ